VLETPRLAFLGKTMSTIDTAGLETAEQTANYTVADTGAGLLVFEPETEYRAHLGREVEIAKELVGFADVSDWNAIVEAVRSRGLGVGAVGQLPEFDLDEVAQ
jgi:hypothetical protein